MANDPTVGPLASPCMNANPSPVTAADLSSPPASLKRPELLAPAGSWDCVKAAVENGADAIYFGLDRFNARMRAQNFTEADLPDLIAFLHRRGVKGYITLNTLIFPQELTEADRYLRTIIAAGVDAVIAQDVGICRLIRHLSPDFPIHASTQMTITSAAGVQFAEALGCQLVVLARECSLKEIRKIQQQLSQQAVALPLEVFVHGALCVAYSGQCLTSEALGGRSANRGECAQACRMTYDLIADGQRVDLGDRSYLLSPQDLAGLELLPDLVRSGVACLKIEGRLKSPEYVANVTQIYRQALDRAMAALELESPAEQSGRPESFPAQNQNGYYVEPAERYGLEMAFSRGLYSGWFAGINNQELVHARFGKKRGVYLGEVKQVGKDYVDLKLEAPVKPGDGIVFDHGHPQRPEQGGRVYGVASQAGLTRLSFGRRDLNFSLVHRGDRVWKTSDPELDRKLRQSFAGETPQFQQPIALTVYGTADQSMTILARDPQGHLARVESALPLVLAQRQPLTSERLREQLGRLGNTPFTLGELDNQLQGELLLPVSELNRLRRELVSQLEAQRLQPHRWQLYSTAKLADLLPQMPQLPSSQTAELLVLVRNLDQLQVALKTGVSTLYCEFEDPRKYRQAVERVRASQSRIYVAPPRITKPGETWVLQQVQASGADGYLIRNYDQLQFFAGTDCIGDFSLNVANPLTAAYFRQFGLTRLTASYDLNNQQLEALLQATPPDWFEITIHQHMPMFHMEHCVFCAFLSEGTDYTNCGRPCEQHQVKLRDRIGTEHILQADVGCRNTVFNGLAQTGAEYVARLQDLGATHFRIEFVNESPSQVSQTIAYYQKLLRGEISGSQLWRELKLQNQLGVTRGALG
jgi:U32 family peptidase